METDIMASNGLVAKEELYQYVKTHYWANYRNSSATLSSTCRQLALSVGGICWLIKSTADHKFIACQVNIILIFLVLFFLLDAAQYFISSRSYQKLAKKYDDEITSDVLNDISQLIEPPEINIPPLICYYLKLFFLISSAVLFVFLLIKI